MVSTITSGHIEEFQAFLDACSEKERAWVKDYVRQVEMDIKARAEDLGQRVMFGPDSAVDLIMATLHWQDRQEERRRKEKKKFRK